MATRVGNLQAVAFSLPAVVSAITMGPFAGIIPALYASTFKLDLTFIGLALLISRLFDAVIDPMIGYYSDTTESRFGKRKPWVVAGSFLIVVPVYCLFLPPGKLDETYFLFFMLFLYFAWTLIEIPYQAWMLDLSRDSAQRTRISAFRVAALLLGGILFTLAPTLVPEANGNMNFQVLGAIALFTAIAVPLSGLIAAASVPQGDVYEQPERQPVWELLKSVFSSFPFFIYVLMYAFIGLASGIAGVVQFLYIDSYLKIGSSFTQIYLPAVVLAPLSLPFWVWAANRWGKHQVTALAFLAYAAIMPLAWFIEPGPSAVLPMTIYATALSLVMPLLMITMPAILGDVVDHDELKTGQNKSGQFLAFQVMVAKAMVAIGGPMALFLIGLYGYQPGSATNTPEAIEGMRIIATLLPAVMVIPGVILLWFFPINDKKQALIRQELEARAAARAEA